MTHSISKVCLFLYILPILFLLSFYLLLPLPLPLTRVLCYLHQAQWSILSACGTRMTAKNRWKFSGISRCVVCTDGMENRDEDSMCVWCVFVCMCVCTCVPCVRVCGQIVIPLLSVDTLEKKSSEKKVTMFMRENPSGAEVGTCVHVLVCKYVHVCMCVPVCTFVCVFMCMWLSMYSPPIWSIPLIHTNTTGYLLSNMNAQIRTSRYTYTYSIILCTNPKTRFMRESGQCKTPKLK